MADNSDFLDGGYERARAAMLPSVTAAVEAEYAQRLAGASLARRMWWRLVMRREIARRVERKAPAAGRYLLNQAELAAAAGT